MKKRFLISFVLTIIFIAQLFVSPTTYADDGYAFFLCNPDQYKPRIYTGNPNDGTVGGAKDAWWLHNTAGGNYDSGWIAFSFNVPVPFTGIVFAAYARDVNVDYILYAYDGISIESSIRGKEIVKKSAYLPGDPGSVKIDFGTQQAGEYVFCIVSKGGTNGAQIKDKNYFVLGAVDKRPNMYVDISYSELGFAASWHSISKFKHSPAAYIITTKEVTEEMLTTPVPTTPVPETPAPTGEEPGNNPDVTPQIIEVTPTPQIIEATHTPIIKKGLGNNITSYALWFGYGAVASIFIVIIATITKKKGKANG